MHMLQDCLVSCDCSNPQTSSATKFEHVVESLHVMSQVLLLQGTMFVEQLCPRSITCVFI